LPEGSPPDSTKWTIEVRAKSHNEELQYYTARPENVAHDGAGNLVIHGRREDYKESQFTSSRLNTAGKFEPQYGRVEARIKLPGGKGIWPAFWMLGSNYSRVGWPKCGEIDILELAGSNPDTVFGSLHGPNYSGTSALTRIYSLDANSFTDDFHVFAFEWNKDGMRWLVDEKVFHTRTRQGFEKLQLDWVFDQPFFIILNLAVGGTFDGDPTPTTQFPVQMLVDYVKVFRAE
jgi:beta-glucanase (GH16 family)